MNTPILPANEGVWATDGHGWTRIKTSLSSSVFIRVHPWLNHFNCVVWVNAPFPAESHAANRTHFFPAGSNGISNFFDANGASSVAGTSCRPVVLPSPHTS